MESFYQELQQGGQSTSKDAWLLVYSCVRCYFKELPKVRAPTQTASNISSPINIADDYLWSLAQSQRVSADFLAHRWREYPSITGVINYHLFRFMVPLSVFEKEKQYVVTLTKLVRDQQGDITKLTNRIKALEQKK